MSDLPFDMPDETRPFEERGGWLVRRLSALFDLQPFQAAGFVGNPGYESAGFKILQEMRPAVEGSRGGYGWSQWTGPRRRAFEAWALAHGLKPSNSEANYGFMVEELRRGYGSMLTQLRQTKTIEEAVFLVGRLYEAPGGTTATHLPGFAGRLHYAQRALAGADATRPSEPQPETDLAVIEATKAFQQALKDAGFDPGPVDGDFGPLTYAAVLAYEASR